MRKVFTINQTAYSTRINLRSLWNWGLTFGLSFLLLGCNSPNQVDFLKPTVVSPTFTPPTNTHGPSSTPANIHPSSPIVTLQIIPSSTSILASESPTIGGGTSKIYGLENTLLEPQLETALTGEDCIASGLPELACMGVTENDEWGPFIRDFSGVEMALVPAGCFQMGNDDGLPEEQPVHEICFEKPYWVDITEVTVAQFARFMNDQPNPVNSHEIWLDPGFGIYLAEVQLIMEGSKWMAVPGRVNKPLESVRWVGARDYCNWRGARLPTEAEWEYAARGPDNWLYPWGNEFIADNVVRHHGQTPDVGSKPQGVSWVGAMDMSSSLFEWTSSIYLPYPYKPDDGREASLENNRTSNRVFRGSAWYHPEGMHDNVSATARFDAPPDYAAWYYGFRCARSID
jgi:formylglycine-generating enzyme required for sulfatase activity